MSAVFLEDIFSGYPEGDPCLCEIRCIPPRRAAPNEQDVVSRSFGCSRLAEAMQYARDMSSSHDVYYGVLPRTKRAREGRAGADGDVAAARWLWCDLDRGDAADAEMKAFLADLSRRVPAPRWITLSGSGGLHCYWPLSAPVSVRLPADADRFTQVLRRLVALIGTGPGNIHADRTCCNLSRVLRVPHTQNHKYDPPRPVRLWSGESSALTLDQWDAALPWEPLPKHKLRPSVSPTQFRSQRSAPPGLIAWAERGYPEGNRHHDLVGAAAWLRRATDLDERLAYDLFRLKASLSVGRRPITEAEMEKAWNWAA